MKHFKFHQRVQFNQKIECISAGEDSHKIPRSATRDFAHCLLANHAFKCNTVLIVSSPTKERGFAEQKTALSEANNGNEVVDC